MSRRASGSATVALIAAASAADAGGAGVSVASVVAVVGVSVRAVGGEGELSCETETQWLARCLKHLRVGNIVDKRGRSTFNMKKQTLKCRELEGRECFIAAITEVTIRFQ